MTFQACRARLGRRAVDARLVFWDGELCAVLTRCERELDGVDGWYLEAAFGPLERPQRPSFDDLAQAQAWLTAELAARAENGAAGLRPH